MKPVTFFLALSLILLFTKPSLSSRAIVDDTIVYDASGNPLQKDASYIINPIFWGAGGGPVILGTPNENNGTCVADVLQWPVDIGRLGTPFTFTPVADVPLDEDGIKLGKPVAIQSPTVNPCKEGSTVWKVTTLTGSGIITTGGIINTATSCLRFTKPQVVPLLPNSYIFEYCPYLCGAGPRFCWQIGVYTINNQRHLSPRPSSSPFQFVLSKASEPAVISEVI